MANPTSGEWVAKEHSIFSGDKMILMSAVRNVSEEERAANLSLAAASKELYEAVDRLLLTASAAVDPDNHNIYKEKFYEAREKGYAAIQKATNTL